MSPYVPEPLEHISTMTSTKQEARAIWHSTTALTAKPQKRGKTHARLPDSWRPDAFITPTVLVVDMNKLDGLTPERKPSPKRISIKAPTKAPSKIVLRDPNAAKTSKSIAPARAPATPTKIPKPVSKRGRSIICLAWFLLMSTQSPKLVVLRRQL